MTRYSFSRVDSCTFGVVVGGCTLPAVAVADELEAASLDVVAADLFAVFAACSASFVALSCSATLDALHAASEAKSRYSSPSLSGTAEIAAPEVRATMARFELLFADAGGADGFELDEREVFTPTYDANHRIVFPDGQKHAFRVQLPFSVRSKSRWYSCRYRLLRRTAPSDWTSCVGSPRNQFC